MASLDNTRDGLKRQPGQPNEANDQGTTWNSITGFPLSLGENAGFTADAVIFDPAVIQFTADAVLLRTVVNTRNFSANALLNTITERTFTAKAWLGPAPGSYPIIFEDDFNNRIVSDTPGTTSGRGHYQHAPFANGGYSIDGSTIVVSGTLVETYNEASFIYGPSGPDIDVQFDFYTNRGGYYFFESASYYHAALNRWFLGDFEIFDDSATGTSDWQIATAAFGSVPISVTDNTWFTVRALIDSTGATVKIRVWETALSEPGTWDIERAISERVNDTGVRGRRLYVGFNNDIFASDSLFDNFIIRNRGEDVHDFFTGDATIQRIISSTFTGDAWFAAAGGGTFTADAVLEAPATVATFTANAYLVSTAARTFTANAKISNLIAATFTGNAYLKSVVQSQFFARAILLRPQETGSKLKKLKTLHILDHRQKPLPTYLPPKIPDETEVPNQFNNRPPCLPPCPGSGAGYGTGYGANGGATVYTVTHCTSGSCPEGYFNSGDGWLGQGAIGTTTHCDCATSHSQTAHVNRMWITYLTIPTGPFRMRAKLIWDVGSPPNVVVKVYANSSPPSVLLGDCDTGGAYWSNGNYIGSMSFSADGNGSLAGRSVWFQNEASSLLIDPNAISTNTFRFELGDEGQHYRAEFKATTAEIVID